MSDRIDALEQRVAELEAAMLALSIQPEADGFITNGYESDDATMAMLTEEYGEVHRGDPRPTNTRTVDELKADGIVGLYVVRQ